MEKLESADRRGIDGNLVDDGSDTHTPTPWSIDREAGGDYGVMIDSPAGSYIGEISSDAGLEEAESNAAFIVKAVNCHEELVEAMKTVIKDIEYGSYGNALSVLRFTIAKAEGK